MPLALLFVILSFATMRIARLIVKDTIFKEPRERFIYWLAHGKVTFDEQGAVQHKSRRLPLWRDKAVTLLSCAYCVSFDVAGIVVAIQHFFVDPLPAPWWWWPAVAGASLIPWEYIDGE